MTKVPCVERPVGPAEALDVLLSSAGLVLTTHINADGDAIGSQAALATFLNRRLRSVAIINPTPFPDAYRFLLHDPAVVVPVSHEVAASYAKSSTLAVIVDAGQVPRIGRVNKLVRHLPKLVIDHHPPGPRPFQGMVYRDESLPATGSMILQILEHARIRGSEREVWPPIASALYVALLADTGGFRFANVDAACFRTAARLVELGADPEALHQAVYGRFPRRRFELLREALATLQLHPDGRIAWMTVPKDAFDRLGATVNDLEGFVDVPRSIDGVEVAMLFRITADGKTKASLRATGEVDVNQVATALGGGGHPRAAGVVLEGDRSSATAQLLARVEEALALADAAAEAAAAAQAKKDDAAARDRAAHEEAARDRAAHEEAAQDQAAHDQAAHDEADEESPPSEPARSNVLRWPIQRPTEE